MPRKIIWTEGQDTRIRRLRTEGAPWDMIAQQLGLARWTVIERARVIGVEQRPAHAAMVMDDSMRPPLPAGHQDSWGVINRDTALRGVAFRSPGAIR